MSDPENPIPLAERSLETLLAEMRERGVDADPVHRLGHHAIELLVAAREIGSPDVVRHAEITAVLVGRDIARRLRQH